MNATGWFTRPVAAVCISLAVLVASTYLIVGADFGPRESDASSVFSIIIRHFGVDVRAMERMVAIPLEDLLAATSGAILTSSTSEYGMARVSVKFKEGMDKDAAYESVRDAAQRVYDKLPSSAQRPEINSESEGSGPVWTASVYSGTCTAAELGMLLERMVKPALEKLAGVGSVEIAGTGMPEVLVQVDESAGAMMGISVGTVARALSEEDVLMPAGILSIGGLETTIIADGRYRSLDQLGTAKIPQANGSSMVLGNCARIAEEDRRPEALARVDGRIAVTIAIKPSGMANLPKLSKEISREIANLSLSYGIGFRVLSDTGALVARSFNSTLRAMLQATIAVALASALLVGSRRQAAFVAVLAVPFILVISAAILSALGVGLDTHVFAGLAAGLGASVDSAILTAERLGLVHSVDDGKKAMRELAPSLVSGTATMLVALVPLASLEFLSMGVGKVAASIAVVSMVSLFSSVILMPPLILHGVGTTGLPVPANRPSMLKSRRSTKLARQMARQLYRVLGLNAILCSRWPAIPLVSALALGITGIMAFGISPLDSGGSADEDTVYAHIEFEPGADMESVDERLAEHALLMAAITGATSVQTTARRGYGSELITFNPALNSGKNIGDMARNFEIPGGFLWIPQPSKAERTWELVVSGDDDFECRRLATLAADAVSTLPFVIDTVLNYKDGPLDLVLRPDRERTASLGIGLGNTTEALRMGIHGPVAYKRLGLDGETDVRVTILDDDPPGIEDAQGILVSSQENFMRADSFMIFTRERDASRIHRRDRRRIASITIRSLPVDVEKAGQAVEAILADISKPKGYAMEFDREALDYARRLRGVVWSFVLAGVLAYMVTALITESFGAPLAVLSVLPASLAVPAILLAVSGMAIDASVACAFVAVSGMAVNASVLTVDERRLRWPEGKAAGALDLYRLTRARIASLAAICGTSALGAVPFLFLADTGSSIARSVAFVASTGTVASFFVSMTVVPALASVVPGLFKTFSFDRSKEAFRI